MKNPGYQSKACWFTCIDEMGGLNSLVPNNTLIQNKNNYIQINDTVLS